MPMINQINMSDMKNLNVFDDKIDGAKGGADGGNQADPILPQTIGATLDTSIDAGFMDSADELKAKRKQDATASLKNQDRIFD